MLCDQNKSSDRLFSAVSAGDLKTVTELINCFGPSYLKAWSDGYILLCEAAKMNRTEVVELLLKSGSAVNGIYDTSNTDGPLHFAALYGNIDIVNMLLNKGININAKNQYGQTPLFNVIDNIDYYCKQEKIEIIQLLLKHKADVNNSDNDSISPLHIAVKKRCPKIVELLLQYGADINCMMLAAKSNKNYTPLHYAVEYNLKDVTILLLNGGANVHVKGENDITPLHIAAGKGFSDIIELLLNHGACINSSTLKEGYTSLHMISENGSEEIMTLFLTKDADINITTKDNSTPLHIAIKSGHETIAKLLLQYGAKVDIQDKKGKSVLHLAAEEGHLTIAEDILNYCKNYNINAEDKCGNSPIFYAIFNGDLEMTKLLLTNNPILKDECIIDLLMVAIKKGLAEICKMILNRGVDVNACNEAGVTLLQTAIDEGYVNIVEMLLEYGAEVNPKSSSAYFIPLHSCAELGYTYITETLLRYGPDINFRDMDGNTALHVACIFVRLGPVTTLLKHGADINIVNNDNETPLSLFKVFSLGSSTNNIFLDIPMILVLEREIIKMKTANLYVSETNLKLISNHEINRDFQNKCEKEIDSMKSEKIHNTLISFYDILTKNTNTLAKYMRNENIVQFLESSDFKLKFPLYGSMIQNNFKMAIKRKELIENVKTIFSFLFDNLPKLKEGCIENIISYLNDGDLKIIVDACKPDRSINSNSTV